MKFRMPAEWELHDSTWLAWPHEKSDWPGRFDVIPAVYVEILKALTESEKVNLIVKNVNQLLEAKDLLDRAEVGNYQFHIIENDRCWMRDSAPTCVYTLEGNTQWVSWKFNAWSKYNNFGKDQFVASKVAAISEIEEIKAEDSGKPVVLEGGAIDADGEGTLLVTEECLMSEEQQRNPGFKKEDYERVFARYLGTRKTIWLGQGIPGDDTHGHIDGVCRFVAPHKVVLCGPRRSEDSYRKVFEDNLKRLSEAKDAHNRSIEVVEIPLPDEIIHDGYVLPASYANFLIANTAVLVPIFKDNCDEEVLEIFAGLFPGRKIVGINCRDFILGLGAIHCITQPQFA